jgi:hypothetical protein
MQPQQIFLVFRHTSHKVNFCFAVYPMGGLAQSSRMGKIEEQSNNLAVCIAQEEFEYHQVHS